MYKYTFIAIFGSADQISGNYLPKNINFLIQVCYNGKENHPLTLNIILLLKFAFVATRENLHFLQVIAENLIDKTKCGNKNIHVL